MKYIFFILVLISFDSCTKEDKPQVQQNNNNSHSQDDDENSADTNLTPEEKFSSSILSDFLSDSEDEDLASFLETQVYGFSSTYNGAAVVEITPSTWLVMLEKNGTTKNYILQKYVDFRTNEYYFTFEETTLTLNDIITKGKSKTSAGE